MRELTAIEIEEVSGGFVWFLACGAAIGIVWGASYLAGYASGSSGQTSTSMNIGVNGFGFGGSIGVCTQATHP